MALSMEEADGDVMKRKPINAKQGIFTKDFTGKIAVRALIIGLVTIAAYYTGLGYGLDIARTMCFAVMIFSQLTIIFSIRSGANWFFRHFFTNRWLWMTIALVIALTLCVMLIPALQSLLSLAALSGSQWWIVIGLTLASLLLSEAYKSRPSR